MARGFQVATKCAVCLESGKVVIATKQSVKRGEPRCFRCDPNYTPPPGYKRFVPSKPKPKRKKSGNRSDVMPDEYVEVYELVIEDREYTSLRDSIATNEARMRKILSDIKENPKNTTPFIKLLAETMRAGRRSVKNYRKTAEMVLDEVEAVIENGLSQVNLWEEYDKIAEQNRKLSESEVKRLTALGWSPDKVEILIDDIAGIIERLEAERILSAQSFFERLSQSRLFQNMVRLAPSESASIASPATQMTVLEAARSEPINVTPRRDIALSVDTQSREMTQNDLEFLEDNR